MVLQVALQTDPASNMCESTGKVHLQAASASTICKHHLQKTLASTGNQRISEPASEHLYKDRNSICRHESAEEFRRLDTFNTGSSAFRGFRGYVASLTPRRPRDIDKNNDNFGATNRLRAA